MKKFFKHGAPENGGGYLIWRATLIWQRRIKYVLAPHNLTQVQFAILASILWLENVESSLNQQKIADYVGIEKMMTSEVIRTLEKKKLIKRITDIADGRGSIVHLLPAGRKTTLAALGDVEREDDLFLSPLKLKKKAFLEQLSLLIEERPYGSALD